MLRKGLALIGLAMAAGCGGNDSGADMTSNAQVARNFDQINSQVLQKNCTFSVCHAGGVRAAGALDLTGDAYTALVNVAAVNGQASQEQLDRVKPCDADKSFLMIKLRLAPPGSGGIGPYGENMPKNNPSLPPEQLQAISDWIARGAHRDESPDVMGSACMLDGTTDGGSADDGGAGDMANAPTPDLTMAQGPDLAMAQGPDLAMAQMPDLAMAPTPDMVVVCPTVESEPNDFNNVANPLCLGTGVSATIDNPNDVDWYTFQLNAGDQYTVALTQLPWDYTFNVYHLDAGRLTLYFSATDLHDLADQIESYSSTNGGTYFVKVYSYWGDSDATHPYRITVSVN
jgi:hypothetical protein